MHGVLVGGLVEGGGGAVDLVSGYEESGYRTARQTFLLVGVEVLGNLVPDVEGAGGKDFTAFQAKLVEQVEELLGGAARSVGVDRAGQGLAVDLDVGAALVDPVTPKVSSSERGSPSPGR
ncbi:hypothetical protein ACH4SK_11890 [Streptomyces inhibens]|uniref:hypothetical protein n=1 Tax=Streptomyces inhibens TaxID=2293571 RepID=UPI0037AE550F